MRRQIEQQLGPVDVLVANAGGNYTKPGPLEDVDEEGWRLSIDGNLTATFLCLKSFLPGMKERRRGSIVTISSAAARRPHLGTPIPYAAAKAGVIGFTRSLAYEVAEYGVTVNAIAPGPIDTELFRKLPEDWRKRKIAELPIRRAGTVDEIAPTALLLASDEGSYYLGATLNPNGGDVMI